ncbi:MAG TPA: hypothetical protein DEA55_06565 [Rhodospirillaceae bacterium]|nr:hypothetical protein [Rhodospirillaceae bacterium]
MGRIVYYAAITVNILALLALLLLAFFEANRTEEAIGAFAAGIPPLLALLALRDVPDWEERKLSRSLRKAKLRKELKELGENQ